MAIQVKGDGNFSIEYEGAFSGLDTSHPETLLSDKASPSFNNFLLKSAELRSRPALVQHSLGPTGGLNAPQVGISSFLDANGTYHTVIWTGNQLWQYNPNVSPPWTFVGTASPGSLINNTVSFRTFANAIYYTDIGFYASLFSKSRPPIILPFVAYWDGLQAVPVFSQTYPDTTTSFSIAGISKANSPTVGGSLPGGPTIIGPIAIGAGYISELNNQLILANVSIRDQGAAGGAGLIYNFPNLIWWSANGLPLQWDPTVNTSAGFNPFLDVPDLITGIVTMGVAGYIFRTNGITQFAPTGSAVTPFQFDHMWSSDHGIGNVLPWSIAQYGPQAVFIAQDNIYQLSITNAEPIGGSARNAIYADIANATGTCFAAILPEYKAGYVYLTYNILIPFDDFVRMYVYSFEDKNWSPWDLGLSGNPPSTPALACAPNFV